MPDHATLAGLEPDPSPLRFFVQIHLDPRTSSWWLASTTTEKVTGRTRWDHLPLLDAPRPSALGPWTPMRRAIETVGADMLLYELAQERRLREAEVPF